MRNVPEIVKDYLKTRRLVARDFLWIEGRTRDTGALVTDGTWSGVGNITADVVNPDTGNPESRAFYGSGTLVEISDIPLVTNLSVQQVHAQANQINAHMEQLVREFDIRHGKVEIYRGLFDPETRQLVAPAECRFVGFVDTLTISTPAEGEVGTINMTFVSHTQDLIRSNAATRSHESMQKRFAGDNFYKDSASTTEWKLFWGSQQGKVATQKKRKKFLGIF
ncbi:hypothetical protein [Rhizobium phage RHph_X2_26]|nr:hypothetical protein [Rhizobium phage RHph_X2_26]